MARLTVVAIRDHPRGRLYEVRANGKAVTVLFTFHSLERMARWRLAARKVLHALLFPEEVLRGHRNRFIAHLRDGTRVVRAIYEYERRTAALVTVYRPLSARYFQGGGIYEDRILP
jgi:hypothetical protein